MAHLLMNHDNMFSAGEVPWHGLGVIVEGSQTAEDAIQLATLGWTVRKEPIYRFRDYLDLTEEARQYIDGLTRLGVPVQVGNLTKIAAHASTVRDDLEFDNPAAVLGVVGESYQPIDNHVCFQLIDDVVGSMGAKYCTAGSLRNGKDVWLLAECPNHLQIKDDVIRPYLLLSTSHDGTKSLEVKLTLIRVVCNNTLAAAMADSSTFSARVKHTVNSLDANGRVRASVVSDVREQIRTRAEEADLQTYAMSYFQEMSDRFNRFADTTVSNEFVVDFLNVLIPESISLRPNVRSHNRRQAIFDLYCGQMPGDNQEAMKIDRATNAGTAWRLLNAVTHFNDHMGATRLTTDKATGEKKSAAEARFSRIFAAANNLRDIADRLIDEGITTSGRNFKEVLAKREEMVDELRTREALVN